MIHTHTHTHLTHRWLISNVSEFIMFYLWDIWKAWPWHVRFAEIYRHEIVLRWTTKIRNERKRFFITCQACEAWAHFVGILVICCIFFSFILKPERVRQTSTEAKVFLHEMHLERKTTINFQFILDSLFAPSSVEAHTYVYNILLGKAEEEMRLMRKNNMFPHFFFLC